MPVVLSEFYQFSHSNEFGLQTTDPAQGLQGRQLQLNKQT